MDRPKDLIVLDHIKQTYQWLNGHAEEAQHFLRQKEDIALFLNIEDPASDTEDWIWKKAIHILLDTYDTGPLQYPRAFLTGFRPLLTAAGAVTIDYGPNIGIQRDQPTNEDRFLRLSGSFDQMRKHRMCTDVGFVCSSLDDEPLYAHRGYLAASTSYFKELFTGTFPEAGDASHTNPILVHVPGFSRRCVESVLGQFGSSSRVRELTATPNRLCIHSKDAKFQERRCRYCTGIRNARTCPQVGDV